MIRWGCVLIMPVFKRGDPAPKGYLQWHEWARVQLRAGLRQRRCPRCGLWNFPQEKCCVALKDAQGEEK
jgi:hypothetical protein